MDRLISADALYKILESCEIRKATIGNPLTDWEYGYTCGIERAESEIECAPTVDAELVRHGRWIYHIDDLFPSESTQECSICHEHEYITLCHETYCPNCGADMRGDNSEHE